jgi:hypothetical protein
MIVKKLEEEEEAQDIKSPGASISGVNRNQVKAENDT